MVFFNEIARIVKLKNHIQVNLTLRVCSTHKNRTFCKNENSIASKYLPPFEKNTGKTALKTKGVPLDKKINFSTKELQIKSTPPL